MKRVSGTREWSVASVNCVTGCEHDCKYCYSRYNLVDKFKKISADEWTNMNIRENDVKKKQKKYDGTVMFPTTHDICPSVLDECMEVIQNILDAGNNILIVSKPHLKCIEAICVKFKDFKDKILFRFTIGAIDDKILSYWEPNAPNHFERLSSLKHAFLEGFKTSVSCEPMLDMDDVEHIYFSLVPYVTDSIWIGKMNNIKSRVKIETEEDRLAVERIEASQTDDEIKKVYELLKDEPKIKWKESFKEVLGIDLAEKSGTDK